MPGPFLSVYFSVRYPVLCSPRENFGIKQHKVPSVIFLFQPLIFQTVIVAVFQIIIPVDIP